MLCGVTATLGSNPSATATAARPRWGRAALSCPSGVCPGRALCARVVCVRGVLCHARRLFCLKYRSGSSAMSHVIPPRLLQTLNRGRWNCNVCGLSRKMTELNYVRLSEGWLPPSLSGPSSGRGPLFRPRAALSGSAPSQAPPLHRPCPSAPPGMQERRNPEGSRLCCVCSCGGRATSARASSRRTLSSSTSP